MVADLDTQSILGFALLAIIFTAIGEALRRKDQTFRIPTSAYFAGSSPRCARSES